MHMVNYRYDEAKNACFDGNAKHLDEYPTGKLRTVRWIERDCDLYHTKPVQCTLYSIHGWSGSHLSTTIKMETTTQTIKEVKVVRKGQSHDAP